MAGTDSGIETEYEGSDNSLSVDSSKFNFPSSDECFKFSTFDVNFSKTSPFINDFKMSPRENFFSHYCHGEHHNKIQNVMCRKHCRTVFKNMLDERKLRIAANLNNVELVEKLLKSKVNPCSADSRKRTALHIAASKDYTDIVKLLLEYKADPNQQDVIGNTPLHLAVCANHVNTVTLLLKAGTNVQSPDNSGRTPLHLAQSKLKLLQLDKSYNSEQLKHEVHKLIDMLQVYLKNSGQNMEAELINAFASRLNLTQTKEEVDTNVRELLSNLSHLSLHRNET